MAGSGEQKQSKECVQKLEQSREDAKQGEVEARREAEYFRGTEVERKHQSFADSERRLHQIERLKEKGLLYP
jgi:hypothetical protein